MSRDRSNIPLTRTRATVISEVARVRRRVSRMIHGNITLPVENTVVAYHLKWQLQTTICNPETYCDTFYSLTLGLGFSSLGLNIPSCLFSVDTHETRENTHYIANKLHIELVLGMRSDLYIQ